MKFKITSVGYWNKPLEETYPVLNFYKFEQKTRSGYCWTEYFGEIELDTLEDLVMLEHNLNKQIVLIQNDDIDIAEWQDGEIPYRYKFELGEVND